MSEVPFHGQEEVADNHEGSSKERGGTSDEFYNRGSQPKACNSERHISGSEFEKLSVQRLGKDQIVPISSSNRREHNCCPPRAGVGKTRPTPIWQECTHKEGLGVSLRKKRKCFPSHRCLQEIEHQTHNNRMARICHK